MSAIVRCSGSHLRLIEGIDDVDTDPVAGLEREVRSTRRDLARLLRALQAAGLGVAGWPDEIVTRLAHLDAVTARWLLGPDAAPPEVARQSVAALRAIGSWVVRQLPSAELARVRAFELMIRIEATEVAAPLLRPDGAPEDHATSRAIDRSPCVSSLRAGLRSLDDRELAGLSRRLGLRPLDLEPGPPAWSRSMDARERSQAERAVLRVLRDDHLLGILVATLTPEAHVLLAALIRRQLPPAVMRGLAQQRVVATAGGDAVSAVPSAVTALQQCGLVFRSTATGAQPLWVPAELQRRLDGVLRALGA
jgi:hypothetical protein